MNSRLRKIQQICRKYQVQALYVFGSRSAEILQAIREKALEIQSSPSDLDIGILTHSPLFLDEKVNITLELEELFNAALVDLVILQEADAFLAANIIRGERLYAENSYMTDEYELFVLAYAGELIEMKRSLI